MQKERSISEDGEKGLDSEKKLPAPAFVLKDIVSS